jgi:hypothetical protein
VGAVTAILATLGLAAAMPNLSIVPGAKLGAQRYDKCADLLKIYPTGIAKSRMAAAGTAAVVDAELYRVNGPRLDRDKDGIMCEQGASKAAPPTRTGKDRDRRGAARDRLRSGG